jgi:hypothetical protein
MLVFPLPAEHTPIVALTLSVNGVPAVPAVNVIWLVPWPDVIVPFVITQV